MNNQNNDATETDNTGTDNVTVDNVPATTVKPARPAAVKPGRGVAWLGLLIALLALAAAGYSGWMAYNEQRTGLQLQADIRAALQRVDEQAAANRELQGQFQQLQLTAEQKHQQLQQTIADQQRRLASQQRRLQSMSTTDRDDWLLAEAEYLMRLANQRLLMSKDINGALELLKAADEIAIELDDAGLFAVREALANDMAKLRSAGRFDLEGIYLELGALIKQVDQLRLMELPEFNPTTEQKPQTEEGWQQSLQYGVQAAWQKLQAYIQITRRDEIYRPLLSPEYEAAVRQNLRLMLEQAQQASLAGKQTLYSDSLTKARQWLKDYYTLDLNASQPLVGNINELLKQPVTIQLPDISSSLRALKDYIQNLHQLPDSKASLPPSQSGNTPDTSEEVEEPLA